jgi:hypothetical protein
VSRCRPHATTAPNLTGVDRRQQLLEPRSRLPACSGAIVVHYRADEVPAAACDQLAAVLGLAGNAEPFTVAVL